MKELRPPSAGRSEVRILLVFDPWLRSARPGARPARRPEQMPRYREPKRF